MTIQKKITATYVVLMILIIGTIGTFISLQMETYFQEQLVDDLSRQADLVLYILQQDSVSSFQTIDKQVKLVGGIEHLRITLIDADGKVLADSDVPMADIPKVENHLSRPELQDALKYVVGKNIRHSVTVHRDFLYMAKRIQRSSTHKLFQTLRFIRLSVPLEDVQAQVNRIRAIVVLVGVVVLLLVLAVTTIISGRITKPMVEIAQGVEHIRQGNLDTLLPITSTDESGIVAKAVNELVDKLKADIVQLKKLEQVRSQFLGNVSHELRTPIFSIQGYLETLLAGAIDDPAVNKSFLEKAQTNLERLNTLLEDLINISQIESGEMKMSFRIFEVNEFLRSVVQEYEVLAKNRHVHLQFDTKLGEAAEMYGDRERLRQVLNNLLSNAINYNRENGDVFLRAEKIEQGIRLSVQDTGGGIPSEHLTRIFERFYRVDSDRSRAMGGTGLGLAIVKHILEAHSTTIQVESKVGEGSTFRFVIKSV